MRGAPEPGIRDHGARHLIQPWRAPEGAPVHPEGPERREVRSPPVTIGGPRSGPAGGRRTRRGSCPCTAGPLHRAGRGRLHHRGRARGTPVERDRPRPGERSYSPCRGRLKSPVSGLVLRGDARGARPWRGRWRSPNTHASTRSPSTGDGTVPARRFNVRSTTQRRGTTAKGALPQAVSLPPPRSSGILRSGAARPRR